jgi:hypothetical protein
VEECLLLGVREVSAGQLVQRLVALLEVRVEVVRLCGAHKTKTKTTN